MCLKLAGALGSAVKRLRYDIGQERYAAELPHYATELLRNAMDRRAAPISQGRTVPKAKSVTV
ncbi:hypothetical protein [Enterocloster asparagiformis]|uniref:hypothetical protein n=1 Tax=Enterocloster asparagiformis TaxID=333367 RepID=UPI0004672E12|nr:hypothetical protein [Enterocloster asparagiformis]